jgi:hypothetical protein
LFIFGQDNQSIHQMPDLAWEYLYLSLASLDQQSVTPDLNSQIISYPNHALREGAVHAQYFEFDCQMVYLARANEPIAGEAVFRLLSHEARFVAAGDFCHCAGSPSLAMVELLIGPLTLPHRRAVALRPL